jgi:FixJ family two-component response regulator
LKLKRLRIAVVDDEAHVRKALERLMRGAGFEVDTYADGIDFLGTIANTPPDCVVLDVHMPGMNGFEVQDAICASGARIAVVVITGHDSPEASGRALANGAFAYMQKPVDGPDLIATITRAAAAACV